MAQTHSLFFYGTLVHPSILARVIGSDGAHLTTSDAILDGHTRHHVNGEDYPAVVPASAGKAILGRELSETEGRVQGSLVSGLTEQDVALLDEFEGNEYAREQVTVTLDSGSASAEVYLWTDPLSRLSTDLWSFEDFMRDSAHRWVGEEGETRGEYAEVDRRRAMGGFITPTGVKEVEDKIRKEQSGGKQELEPFGRAVREKYWTFPKGWINLNHGSYGVPPKPVVEAFRKVQDRTNSVPDRFMKVDYMQELVDLRARLADLVQCDTDDLVVVGNATIGVNTVLRSLSTSWEQGDKFLFYSTTIYDACNTSLQYIMDTHKHLNMTAVPVPLVYPVSHADLINATEKAIAEANATGGGKIRLALFDSISSNPGVIVPWEELVALFRENGILSLVDAAHHVGQLPANLRETKPDFWISNCHKWLLAHRACAVLYVAKEHQHLMHSIPNGYSYVERDSLLPDGQPGWISEFEWNGTIDYSPYLATHASLDFRRDVLGGEERITEYCHKLAIEGGELFAKTIGTETMRNKEGEGELVANMINVRLPIEVPSKDLSAEEQAVARTGIKNFWIATLIDEHNTHVPIFPHAGQYWTRLSAQVYNELDEFKDCAFAVKDVCKRISEGEWKRVAEEKAAEGGRRALPLH